MTDNTTTPPPALDADFFRRWLLRSAEAVTANAELLTELDSAIGDADHGVNLDRGFTAVTEALNGADPAPATPKAVLVLASKTLISKVGGASGPLYGTALRAMARTFGERENADGPLLAEALSAAVAAIAALGEAQPGDKTMLDALIPAAEALTQNPGDLAGSAAAAERGAEATVPMRARRGRASYLGDRSIGHRDPGATSTALLLDVLAGTAAQR
jgi:dihydroxyacetone kinase-like protein